MARMVFNLDNPWLSSYYYLLPPSPSDEITCSFLAYPVPDPIAQPGDLSRFGSIISETPERLEIRLTAYELERMHELKQAWVSKYAEEKMICYLRLGSLEPDFSRSLVFQQGYKIPQVSQQADTAANPTLPAISNAPRLLEPVDLEQEQEEKDHEKHTEDRGENEVDEQAQEQAKDSDHPEWGECVDSSNSGQAPGSTSSTI
ncbi:hypothetical protein UCREL1_5862 [Eutypa lata UCREL1]|uniref:Uncharacterized protein n=1 Tax=Eutypa lata (strain UCR-EL1) TaxID=1287681 RepID=M7SRN5_EUTLA|nr:hypothetical protein UCREL1_5862 [Eutypa lata UCREL1]